MKFWKENGKRGRERGRGEANRLSLLQNPNPGQRRCWRAIIVVSLHHHRCCGTLTLTSVTIMEPTSLSHYCRCRASRERGEEDWEENRERGRGEPRLRNRRIEREKFVGDLLKKVSVEPDRPIEPGATIDINSVEPSQQPSPPADDASASGTEPSQQCDSSPGKDQEARFSSRSKTIEKIATINAPGPGFSRFSIRWRQAGNLLYCDHTWQ